MRTSVKAGLLTCTLILAFSSKASAEQVQQNLSNQTSALPTVALLSDEEARLVKVADTKQEEPEKLPIIHEVVKGDSLSSIALAHQTTWKRLFDKNTHIINPDIINGGDKLTIPLVDEIIPEREYDVIVETVKPANIKQPTTKAAVNSTKAPAGQSDGNRYTAGYCTWYVKNKRPDLPNNLGNASTWATRAASQGMATGSEPRTGAVGQKGNHVVYVESVNTDGTVTISEMNYKGLYVQTIRTLPANNFRYIY